MVLTCSLANSVSRLRPFRNITVRSSRLSRVNQPIAAPLEFRYSLSSNFPAFIALQIELKSSLQVELAAVRPPQANPMNSLVEISPIVRFRSRWATSPLRGAAFLFSGIISKYGSAHSEWPGTRPSRISASPRGRFERRVPKYAMKSASKPGAAKGGLECSFRTRRGYHY